MLGEDAGSFCILVCELGECLFGGCYQRPERAVEVGDWRVGGRFDEAVGDEDAEDILDLLG
jgi:hypothetical protein